MPVSLSRIVAVVARSAFAERSNISLHHDRVRLSDVDWNLHMNYASYLEVMELGRWDWGFRSGAIKLAFANGNSPVVVSVDLHYRKELKPRQRFVVDTRLVEVRAKRFIVFDQVFVVGDRIHAKAKVKVLIVSRRNRSLDAGATSRLAEYIAEPLTIRGSMVNWAGSSDGGSAPHG